MRPVAYSAPAGWHREMPTWRPDCGNSSSLPTAPAPLDSRPGGVDNARPRTGDPMRAFLALALLVISFASQADAYEELYETAG